MIRYIVLAFAFTILFLPCQGCEAPGSLPGKDAYRTTEWGDLYYPRSREMLLAEIQRSLTRSTPAVLDGERASGLLVPHASYHFSSITLGQGFGALRGEHFERIFILGESHRRARGPIGTFTGAALPAEKGFVLSTGTIENDVPTLERLDASPFFARRARPFDSETSIEPLLPFIQALWPEARIVPILLGRISRPDIVPLGMAIRAELDAQSLLVISTTFTHFHARTGRFPMFSDKASTLNALRDYEAPLMTSLSMRQPAKFHETLEQSGIYLCGERALLVGLEALGTEGGIRALAEDWSLRDEPEPLDPASVSGVSYRAILFTQAR